MSSPLLRSLVFVLVAGCASPPATDDTGSDPGDTDVDTDTESSQEWVRGDLDGDGEADFMISVMDSSNDFLATVHVFGSGTDLGSVTLDDADFTYGPEYFVGVSTALCDLDGDGVGDLLVGEGEEVHVFFGGPFSDWSTPDLRVSHGSGFFADTRELDCGDVTGDGQDDLVAGFSDDTSGVDVLPGGPALRDESSLDLAQHDGVTRIEASETGTNFGRHVFLADTNNDGVCDVVVGEIMATFPEGGRYGRAHVFEGGAALEPGDAPLAPSDATFAVDAPEGAYQFPSELFPVPSGDGTETVVCGYPCYGPQMTTLSSDTPSRPLADGDDNVVITGTGFHDGLPTRAIFEDDGSASIQGLSLDGNGDGQLETVVADVPTGSMFLGQAGDQGLLVGHEDGSVSLLPAGGEATALESTGLSTSADFNYGPALGCGD